VSRQPKSIRFTAAVGGLGVALALAGCGGGGGGGADHKSGGEETAGRTTASSVPPPPPETRKSPAGPLDGSWLATTGGKAVALLISGSHAGLFQSDGVSCAGVTAENTGKRGIKLNCSDGGGGRGEGMVASVGPQTLMVHWAKLGDETFQRAKGNGQLPTGLPSPSAQ
jgi:hypothetical protein